MTNEKKLVYDKIAKVAQELSVEGISKDKKNEQQGYKFRGIDAVLNTLAPIISKAGLVILPRCLNREVVERQTKSGGALFNVTVEVEFDFVAVEDGSVHTVKVFGEAMDSADKATNKAMSAAYKYATILTFCIPTEGDNDADTTTHEVEPAVKKEYPDDGRPWLSEAQLNECLRGISQGKVQAVQDWLKGFKMKTTYRNDIEAAIKKVPVTPTTPTPAPVDAGIKDTGEEINLDNISF
jgi:hypothetical protein